MLNTITLEDKEDYLVYRVATGNTVEIVDIAVHTIRRLGRGTRLVKALIAAITTRPAVIYAISRNTNRGAHEFYEALGFRRLGRLEQFYPIAKEDAVVYGVTLCE